MEKNWLIRTTHNKILGPISKKKLVEFIEKGSLTQNDEVSAGNGYWFSLKEEDLVERFIFTDEKQGFNPITECKTILCAQPEDLADDDDFDLLDDSNTLVIGADVLSQLDRETPAPRPTGEQLLPSSDDLEFPDMGVSSSEAVKVQAPSPEKNKPTPTAPEVDVYDPADSFEGKLPSEDDLAFPDIGDEESAKVDTPLAPKPVAPPSKKVLTNEDNEVKKTTAARPYKEKGRSDYYLFYIFFIMFALVGYAIYFYYSKVSQGQRSIYNDELGSLLIPTVYAQTVDVKKK
ncbi:MAG: hypothetical protein KAG61_09810 [Bacteriovoracaceae bacterium]|nr:hypothetical protein [Bacteriovoracaceae bacterium]